MKEYFKYTLKQPVKIGDDQGKAIDAKSVLVMAPRPRYKHLTWKLEAIVSKAFSSALSSLKDLNSGSNEKETEDESEDKRSEHFSNIIFMGLDPGDVQMLINTLSEILSGGNKEYPSCTINDVKVTKDICEDISHIDLKNILGRYVVYFLSLV